jgi:hypothetical protein
MIENRIKISMVSYIIEINKQINDTTIKEVEIFNGK